MEAKVLTKKISQGILEFYYGQVKSNNRWFLVRKHAYPPDDVRGWRLVVDITANKAVSPDSFPLPSPPGLAEWLSQFVYYWKADATEAYSQKKLTEEAKAYLVIATSKGNLTHSGQPQGLVGSQPAIMRDFAFIYKNVPSLRIYVDNFFGGSHSFPELSTNFFKFLDASLAGNVKLTIGEVEFAVTNIEAVGYEVSHLCYSPSRRLTDAMANIPIPRDVKALKSFLASTNFVRNHIPGYNSLTGPLAPLLRKNMKFIWEDPQQQSYNALRDALLAPEVLKPFDPGRQTRLKVDYNGFENSATREPALGASLWQRYGDEWFPCGYASRFLRESEKNLLRKQSAFSSSIGESLAFIFGTENFYPELSQLQRFEVLCDARNLTYWQTSESPLLVRLRAKISGKYDLTKITVRHIPRRLNFSDSLGRLAMHPAPHEPDLSLSTYEYNAQDLLNSPITSNTVPEFFTVANFSPAEQAQLRHHKIATRGPITRVLHGRQMHLVPESHRGDDLWEAAHIMPSGAHNVLSRTRSNLSHLHWRGKTSWILRHWRACHRCMPAAVSHDAQPSQDFSGEAIRCTHFMQVVSFDTAGPKQTLSGPLHLATWLDACTGLFNARVIGTPDAASAIAFVKFIFTYGKKPELALFDRAKSYLASQKFRSFLHSHGVDARYSKGDDPRFILGLERIPQEFNKWHRTLDDPLTWNLHIDEFIFLVNSLVSESSGLSRSGNAFGHGPAHAKAIARRHKTLLEARTDSKAADPPRFMPGSRARLLANPKNKGHLKLHDIDVVDYAPATSLIQKHNGDYQYVANRRIRAIAGSPLEPHFLPDNSPPSVSPLLPFDPLEDDELPEPPPPPVPSPAVGDWCIYSSARRPYIGVITSCETRSVHIHSFEFRHRKLLPVWTDSDLKTRYSKIRAPGFEPDNYLIERSSVLATAPRLQQALFTLPLALKHAIAAYNRDPYDISSSSRVALVPD